PLRDGGDALAARWDALAAFRRGRSGDRLSVTEANRAALASVDQSARQWRRRLRLDCTSPPEAAAHRLGALLAHAWPDRIAFQHRTDPYRYHLANGRSARIAEDSSLF